MTNQVNQTEHQTTKSRKPRTSRNRLLVGKRVLIPRRRRGRPLRGIIVDQDGDYVLVVTPHRQHRVRVNRTQPDTGDPHASDTVPF